MGFIYGIKYKFWEICRRPISQHPGLGNSLQYSVVRASWKFPASLCRLWPSAQVALHQLLLQLVLLLEPLQGRAHHLPASWQGPPHLHRLMASPRLCCYWFLVSEPCFFMMLVHFPETYFLPHAARFNYFDVVS